MLKGTYRVPYPSSTDSIRRYLAGCAVLKSLQELSFVQGSTPFEVSSQALQALQLASYYCDRPEDAEIMCLNYVRLLAEDPFDTRVGRGLFQVSEEQGVACESVGRGNVPRSSGGASPS